MDFHLAQLNIARLLHPLDSAELRPFVDGLEPINRLAEEWPGFVWRMRTMSGNSEDAKHPWMQDPLLLVNLSVWESPEALKSYVYKSGHLEYYLKRAEWFEKPKQAHYVLWWVPAGHTPSLMEAQERLEHYRMHGASPYAFWFGRMFDAGVAAAHA